MDVYIEISRNETLSDWYLNNRRALIHFTGNLDLLFTHYARLTLPSPVPACSFFRQRHQPSVILTGSNKKHSIQSKALFICFTDTSIREQESQTNLSQYAYLFNVIEFN